MFDICVTIVNTNEKSEIERALTSLFLDSKNSGLNIATVIVDNASTDSVDDLTQKFSNLTVVKQAKNFGFGKSHNRAFATVDAKYYFVLNPDTEFSVGQNFLRQLYDFMEKNPKIGMAGPKIIYPDGSLQHSCWRFPTFLQPIFSRTKWGQKGRGKKVADHYLMKDFEHNQTMPVDCVMGSAMFARQLALAEVGGFDDRFWMYFEDMDWCWRMWQKGWAVYYFHAVVLRHVHGRASAKVPGVIMALIKNKYARTHFVSWLKYFWKWRGEYKFYR
ncbi:MAG: hypothetical protein A3J93_00940 [Candidatus Magasanikbacteria bacterium RIFOXYC2_FULL_42_28]|uniref:Glycosyltransferase 2-like domain-containing protein n=1 Tax=Candidatus Magasanikbacteria bacterium RIFOXYC2_FULL_42_28 TaxID=1798704 RepID=A0A1F6NXK7_9BACT|nr:MAG: hypothetical protein A3J93_00940 [Candidatus Magasanikbacteria bacterium RIFOXYC2_FULL_42_28]